MSKTAVRDLLRARGIRPTPRRTALLDTLSRTSIPITAEMLHKCVPKMDLVTVYRTLESLVAARLVREVRFKDAIVRYEIAEEHRHHHHLVCTRCGTVDELPECDLQQLENTVLRRSKKFARVDEHSLEFFGTCVSCAKG